jgi:hypothetical protein
MKSSMDEKEKATITAAPESGGKGTKHFFISKFFISNLHIYIRRASIFYIVQNILRSQVCD